MLLVDMEKGKAKREKRIDRERLIGIDTEENSSRLNDEHTCNMEFKAQVFSFHRSFRFGFAPAHSLSFRGWLLLRYNMATES